MVDEVKLCVWKQTTNITSKKIVGFQEIGCYKCKGHNARCEFIGYGPIKDNIKSNKQNKKLK